MTHRKSSGQCVAFRKKIIYYFLGTKHYTLPTVFIAAVAELADAPGLEPGNRKVVGVQVPSAASFLLLITFRKSP